MLSVVRVEGVHAEVQLDLNIIIMWAANLVSAFVNLYEVACLPKAHKILKGTTP